MASMIGAIGANVYNDFVNSNERAQAQRLRTMQQFKEMLSMAPGMDAKGVFATYQNATAGMDQWVKDAFTSDFLSAVAGQEEEKKQSMELQSMLAKSDAQRKIGDSIKGMIDDAILKTGGDAEKVGQLLLPQIGQFAKYKSAMPMLQEFGFTTGPDGKVALDQDKAKSVFDKLRPDSEMRIYSKLRSEMGDALDWGYIEKNYSSIANGPMGQTIKAKMADDLVKSMGQTPWMFSSPEAVQNKLNQHGLSGVWPAEASNLVRYGQTTMQQHQLANAATATQTQAAQLAIKSNIFEINRKYESDLANLAAISDPARREAMGQSINAEYRSTFGNAIPEFSSDGLNNVISRTLAKREVETAAKFDASKQELMTKAMEAANLTVKNNFDGSIESNRKYAESELAGHKNSTYASIAAADMSNMVITDAATMSRNMGPAYMSVARTIGSSDPAIFRQQLEAKLKEQGIVVVPRDQMVRHTAEQSIAAAKLPSLDTLTSLWVHPDRLVSGTKAYADSIDKVVKDLQSGRINAQRAAELGMQYDRESVGQQVALKFAEQNPDAFSPMSAHMARARSGLATLKSMLPQAQTQPAGAQAAPGQAVPRERLNAAIAEVRSNLASDPRNAAYWVEVAARKHGVPTEELSSIINSIMPR